MKIAILGDDGSENTKSWVSALSQLEGVKIKTWSVSSKKYNRWRRRFEIVRSVSLVRSWLREEKPDIVIGYRITSYGFLGALSGFRPLVLAAQGKDDVRSSNPLIRFILRHVYEFTIKRSDMIHCWGDHMMKPMLQAGAPREKILVLPRGIDNSKFYASQLPKVGKNKITLITTRSLYPEYCHLLILSAIRELLAQSNEVHWTVVGDGIMKDVLLKKAREWRIENSVTFTGHIGQEGLPKLLQNTDIYVSMPDTEGVSASLFEAMACGCFPVVSDLPANRAFIESGKNGILVTPHDLKELVEALKVAIASTDLRIKAASDNCNLVQDKADSKKNMLIFFQAYQNLIGQKQCAE